MVRNYTKKLGGRSYRNYSEEDLQKALTAVRKGVSKSAASRLYKIPRTTLIDKVYNNHPLSVGHPTVLNKEDEALIAKTLGVVSSWGYPMTHRDIALVISGFVQRQGRNVAEWKDNVPGYEFIKHFAARNNLTNRLATNIKSQRACVGIPQITEFFTNIKAHLENAAPSNIFNFDETNLTDDPGAKKVLVPRGMKRVERVQEHSRTSVSIMFCGAASGQLLPPMVVYKSGHLYENWTKGGPDGTVYGTSKSGWFDMVLFERWFFEVMLPYINENSRPEEVKILIGDNLASHFSPLVINAALENNIYMTPLPANATHMMQPLDVSFFAPLKRKWRSLLDDWRKESRRRGTIPKEQFPGLLLRLWQSLQPRAEANLKSGFRSTGLHPFNPHAVLSKLPNYAPNESDRLLDASLLDFLKTSRRLSDDLPTTRKRGKKIPARPGQQIRIIDECPEAGPSASPTEDRQSIYESDDDIPLAVLKKTNQKPQNDLSKENEVSDDLCYICKCQFSCYKGRDWICCFTCHHWVCGVCNKGSKNPQYECPVCEDDD